MDEFEIVFVDVKVTVIPDAQFTLFGHVVCYELVIVFHDADPIYQASRYHLEEILLKWLLPVIKSGTAPVKGLGLLLVWRAYFPPRIAIGGLR
jgi:hypothetical protein